MSRGKRERQRVAKAVGKSTIMPILKADSPLQVSAAALPEDIFSGMYWEGTNAGNILQPPYEFGLLEKLVEENNTLQPCISAYATNISGTGYVIEKDGVEIDPTNIPPGSQHIFDMLNEISPGVSFQDLRNNEDRTLFATGNSFKEVVKNAFGEPMFYNLLPTSSMRIVKKDAPTQAKKKIKRNGKDIEMSVMVRDRAYAQCLGTDIIYFKEAGAIRDINRFTGEWSDTPLPLAIRGNEVIHRKDIPAANSPYGVPRWIPQSPSVVGSREAEEVNVSSIAGGGMYQALFFMFGGALSPEVRKQFSNLNKGARAEKVGGAMIEVQSTGNSTDKDSKPSMMVERFDSSSNTDSMFSGYDKECRMRILTSFRLAKLFIGETEGYNFATAQIAYATIEAQTFKPERNESDSSTNLKIMKELDPTGSHRLRSKPVVLNIVKDQLTGLGMLENVDGMNKESWVTAVASTSGVDVHYEEPDIADEATIEGETEEVEEPVGTKSEKDFVQKLAADWVDNLSGDCYNNSELFDKVKQLSKTEKVRFDKSVALGLFPGAHHDPEGAAEVAGCLCGCEN